jgi:hypothetical protein
LNDLLGPTQSTTFGRITEINADMLKSHKCQAHAEYCQELAAQATIPDVRDDLLKTAAMWNRLAEEHARQECEEQRRSLSLKSLISRRAAATATGCSSGQRD